MPVRFTWPDSFTMRIKGARSASADLGQLMPDLERIAWQSNRDGLLAGTDRDGVPMAPLAASTLRYRKGDGPPLVPRRNQSRMIANYRVTSFRRPDGNWVILGAWQNVLSKKGVPFIPFHADGTRRMPRRDPVGVRPLGRLQVGVALRAWIQEKWSKP